MNHKSEESIFAAAIEIESDAKRSQFLEQACGGDAELRKSVEELLANAQPDSLFQDVTQAIDEGDGISQKGKQLGEFKIIRELGRGGMGVVYEAHQKSLNRNVALKVLSAGLGLTTRAIMRFRREAEAAGKLHHTNIVPIYSTGEDKGVHFYAMELVDGPSLDQVIKSMRDSKSNAAKAKISGDEPAAEGDSSAAQEQLDETTDSDQKEKIPKWVGEKLPFHASGKDSSVHPESVTGSTTGGSQYFVSVARMIADVADALDHAHDHGVIHRDIKPSNLLLGPDGRLSINDFGLARVLEQPGMTMSGEMMGTPRYMSPEQISAGRSKLDHRTDIFSLGATLYELLTLSPPFDGITRDEVIGQILHKDPKPARKINPKIPKDLETICMAAIERDPDRRYQTAGLLAEDLRRFVDGRTPDKKRVGTVGKTIRWVKRHPSRAALIFVSLVSVIAILAVWQVNRLHARQTAMEDAFNYSIIGEFEKADEKRLLAVSLGASQSWNNLIRGQIELFKGNNRKAFDHLEQVNTESEFRLQAECLRIYSNFINGNEQKYLDEIEVLDHLERNVEHSDQDELYLGLAFSFADPIRAEKYLLTAQANNAPVGPVSAFLSQVRSYSAANTLDNDEALQKAKLAVEDALVARVRLGANGLTNSRELWARFRLAATLFDRGDDHEQELAAVRKLLANVRQSEVNADFVLGKFLFLNKFEQDHALPYLAKLNRNELASYCLNYRMILSIQSPDAFDLELDREAVEADLGEELRIAEDSIYFLARIFAKDTNLTELREEYRQHLKDLIESSDLAHCGHMSEEWAICRLLKLDQELTPLRLAIRSAMNRRKNSFVKSYYKVLLDVDGKKDFAELERNIKTRKDYTMLYFCAGIEELTNDQIEDAQQLFEKGSLTGYTVFYNTLFCSILARKLKEPGFKESWIEKMKQFETID